LTARAALSLPRLLLLLLPRLAPFLLLVLRPVLMVYVGLSSSSSSRLHVASSSLQILGSIGITRFQPQRCLKICYCWPQLALVGICCPSGHECIAAAGMKL
jgi:hypothetical protein